MDSKELPCSLVTDPVKIQLKSNLDLLEFSLSLTFNVSVYNHVAVQVGDSLEDLSGVSPRHLLCEGPISFQLVLYWSLEIHKTESAKELKKYRIFNLSVVLTHRIVTATVDEMLVYEGNGIV